MISETQAKKYCKDDISLIENYEEAINDNTQKWDCHHRRETVYTSKDLIEIGEYYKRPAIELIFLPHTEHLKLPHIGRLKTEDHKRKLSEYRTGKQGVKHTEEWKITMSIPIKQFTKDGKFIREWIGAGEAGKQLGIPSTHITSCCKDKRKSAGGFVWKYSESK